MKPKKRCCRIVNDAKDGLISVRIVYCPLHTAAPELLSALKGLIEFCEDNFPNERETTDKYREVVAKAEGGF